MGRPSWRAGLSIGGGTLRAEAHVEGGALSGRGPRPSSLRKRGCVGGGARLEGGAGAELAWRAGRGWLTWAERGGHCGRRQRRQHTGEEAPERGGLRKRTSGERSRLPPRRPPRPAPPRSLLPDGQTWRGGRSRGWARRAAPDSARRRPRAGRPPREPDAATAPCACRPVRAANRRGRGLRPITGRQPQGGPAHVANHRAGRVPVANHMVSRSLWPIAAQARERGPGV